MSVYGNIGQDNVRLFSWVFGGGFFVRVAGCAWLSAWGALLSKYTSLHGENLTLKFLQIRVARWCHCQNFFVVTYPYPNCKVLYEDRLISSHIFIPDHPPHLTPPLPVVGKRCWIRCGEFGQLLGRQSEKIVQLKHLSCFQSPNIFLPYN